MNAVRRIATVVGLTAGVIAGASLPASAAFGDTVALPTTTAGTLTVAAPASVTLNDTCATTTTVVKRTVYTDPVTGVQTQTAYSSSSSTVGSSTNVNSYTASSAAGPGLNETTTTETTQNTMLSVTVSWTASGSRGVSGYLVNAYLVDGTVYPMAQTAAAALSTSGAVDADYLAYQPRLSVTTLTAYGWTATTAQTPVLTC
jgi:hypothetical protein